MLISAFSKPYVVTLELIWSFVKQCYYDHILHKYLDAKIPITYAHLG